MWWTCHRSRPSSPCRGWQRGKMASGAVQSSLYIRVHGEPGLHVPLGPIPGAPPPGATWPSALRFTQQGLPGGPTSLTACVFSPGSPRPLILLFPTLLLSWLSDLEAASRPSIYPLLTSPGQMKREVRDASSSDTLGAPRFARHHAQEFPPSPEFPVLTWCAQFWNFPGF